MLARNLPVTDKITASCKTNMSPKASYETVANKQDERNLQNSLAKTFSKTAIAIRFNFLKKSIHPCLHCLKSDKFCEKAPLISV